MEKMGGVKLKNNLGMANNVQNPSKTIFSAL
jgi:hypothetical protein